MGNCSADNVKESALSATNQGMVAQLKITSYAEQNSKAQMFNYESERLHKHTYHIIDDCVVLKADNQKKHLRPFSHFTPSEENSKVALFQVYKKHNYFKIVPFCIEKDETFTQKNLWFVIRSAPQKKYQIRQKDIVKIGRQKIKIREIIRQDHHLHNAIIDLTQIQVKRKVYNQTKFINSLKTSEQECQIASIDSESLSTCRICLQPGQTSNPLICPCKCIGTVRYIHIKCLRSWLNTRLNVERKQHCIVVKWTPITCQICKSHFKYRVFLDNIKYYTLEIPKPVKPYIVLQIVGKTVQFSRIFLFVSFFNKKMMSIGRGKNSDIQINDPTISRHHSNIFYDEIQKRFYITDHQSKFGTFVYIKKNILVNPHQKHISFQIGGELFSCQALRKSEPFDEYHEQQRYLNVVEKGSEDCLSFGSSENEEQQQQIEDEISSEEEQQMQKNQQLRLRSNLSNIASIPTTENLPEPDYRISSNSSHHQRNPDDLRIVEANMALNTRQS